MCLGVVSVGDMLFLAVQIGLAHYNAVCSEFYMCASVFTSAVRNTELDLF